MWPPVRVIGSGTSPLSSLLSPLSSLPDTHADLEREEIDLTRHFTDIAEYLCNLHPDACTHQDELGKCPLHYACFIDTPHSLVSLLIATSKDSCSLVDKDKRLPLHWAAMSVTMKQETCQMILDAHPEGAERRDEMAYLPIEYALRNENSPLLSLSLLSPLTFTRACDRACAFLKTFYSLNESLFCTPEEREDERRRIEEERGEGRGEREDRGGRWDEPLLAVKSVECSRSIFHFDLWDIAEVITSTDQAEAVVKVIEKKSVNHHPNQPLPSLFSLLPSPLFPLLVFSQGDKGGER